MDQAIKQQWVRALRSGAYPMAEDGLHTSKGYTTLGVLADIYIKHETMSEQWFPVVSKNGETLFGISHDFEVESGERRAILVSDGRQLPLHIQEWADMPKTRVFLQGYPLTLWEGSREIDFSKLAELIEKENTL